jgi:hypothetical protein
MFPYKNLIHSITGDNGYEFTGHQTIAKILKTSFSLPVLMPLGKKDLLKTLIN